MKKQLFALLFTMFAFGKSYQSQNVYSFSKTTGNTYTELTNDSMVPGFNVNGLYNIPGLTGETLKFYGKPFTIGGLKTIAIGEGPFLRIDDDTSAVIIDVAFTQIDTIDPMTKISYKIEGTAGNHIIKVQYRYFKLHTGPIGNFIHVQIWVHQQSGVVELHYGPRSNNNASGYNFQTGPNIGMFYAPDSFTSCYQKLWVHGSPGAVALDSVPNLVFNAMSGVPDEGTIFRFTPRTKPVAPPTPTLNVSLKNNTETLNINILPNPARDKFSINEPGLDGSAYLYNLNGTLVIESPAKDGTEIKLDEFANGIYFLKIIDKRGQQFKAKILVYQ